MKPRFLPWKLPWKLGLSGQLGIDVNDVKQREWGRRDSSAARGEQEPTAPAAHPKIPPASTNRYSNHPCFTCTIYNKDSAFM